MMIEVKMTMRSFGWLLLLTMMVFLSILIGAGAAKVADGIGFQAGSAIGAGADLMGRAATCELPCGYPYGAPSTVAGTPRRQQI